MQFTEIATYPPPKKKRKKSKAHQQNEGRFQQTARQVRSFERGVAF